MGSGPGGVTSFGVESSRPLLSQAAQVRLTELGPRSVSLSIKRKELSVMIIAKPEPARSSESLWTLTSPVSSLPQVPPPCQAAQAFTPMSKESRLCAAPWARPIVPLPRPGLPGQVASCPPCLARGLPTRRPGAGPLPPAVATARGSGPLPEGQGAPLTPTPDALPPAHPSQGE